MRSFILMLASLAFLSVIFVAAGSAQEVRAIPETRTLNRKQRREEALDVSSKLVPESVRAETAVKAAVEAEEVDMDALVRNSSCSGSGSGFGFGCGFPFIPAPPAPPAQPPRGPPRRRPRPRPRPGPINPRPINPRPVNPRPGPGGVCDCNCQCGPGSGGGRRPGVFRPGPGRPGPGRRPGRPAPRRPRRNRGPPRTAPPPPPPQPFFPTCFGSSGCSSVGF